MTELLSNDDQKLTTTLLDRTGLLQTPSDRIALLVEIGLNAADVPIDASNPHAYAVLLVKHLVDIEHREALRSLLLRISTRMHSALDPDLARLQLQFQITADDLRPSGPAAPPVPVAGTPIAVGLDELSRESMKKPRIREAALRFGTVFETARKQIHDVTGYKGLHDQLHDLAQKVEVPMERFAPDFPANEDARGELEEYRIIFEEVNRQLRSIAQRFPDMDSSWIDALDVALDDFRKALQRDDPALLKDVIRRVKRQLTLRLPQITSRLNAAARTLRLADLAAALRELRDDLDGDSKRLRQFLSGVEALENMDRNLTALVRRHDHWQEFDAQLRAMENNLEDLAAWWPDVTDLIERIARSYEAAPAWMSSFAADCNGVRVAIDSGESSKVARSFRLLRRQVGIRFYNTDADLMSQCDELSSVGEPLTTVLRVIA